MDLELKLKELSSCVPQKRQVLTAEETVEFVLNDYCADAGRIISWHTESVITGKRVSDGEFEVLGTVFVTVLYAGMDSEGLRSCRIKIPFEVRQETKGNAAFLDAQAFCENCECRLLNARKILCRVRAGVAVTPYEKRCQRLCDDFTAPAETAVETLWQEADAVYLLGQWEKEFSFMDAVALRMGGTADEVLFSRVTPRITECRLSGTKVLAKGEADIFALCRSEEGEYLAAEASAAFAQLSEIPQGLEEAEYEAAAALIHHTAALISDGGTQKAEVQMGMRLTLRAKKVCRERYLADAYAINCGSETQTEIVTLAENCREFSKKQALQLTPAAGLKPQSVICAEGCCGAVQRMKEGNAHVLSVPVTVQVLYLDETSAPALARSSAQCRLRLETGEEAYLLGETAWPSVVAAAVDEDGISCRAEVEFSFRHCLLRRVGAVVGLKCDGPENEKERPSVTVRRMEEGDTLWQVAKSSRTTVRAIEKANGGTVKKGSFLLIPKART